MRGHLSQRSPGVWIVRVDIGVDPLTGRRKQRAVTVHGTKRDAHRALAELVVAANAQKVGSSSATVRVLLERWFQHAEGRLAASTLREYRRLAEKRILPRFGDVKVSKVTAGMLDGFYDALTADGLSARSVQQIHSVVRRAYAHGVRWGWVTANPAASAEPPALRRVRRASLSPEQIIKAILAADELAVEFGVFCRVVAATGARRGEVCALRATDLHLQSRLIHVDRSITTAGGRVEKDTKSHGVRDVSIDTGTTTMLTAHLDLVARRCLVAGERWVADRFVFSNEVGGSLPWHPDTVTHWWAEVRAKAGLPKWARLHDLRHAHATLLLDAGVPLPVVSERLGHADAHTTLVIYAHAVAKRDRQASDLFGGFLDGGPHGKDDDEDEEE